MAYIDSSQKMFTCIAAGDREGVAEILASEVDLSKRDHVGRTPLQVAILCKNTDIACDLIDAGARMIARLFDGRTALHLAAQLGLDKLIKVMLTKSEQNKLEAEEKVKKAQEAAEEAEKKRLELGAESEVEVDDDPERPSSDDDWSSEGSEPRPPKKKVIVLQDEIPQPPGDESGIPEDNEELPDVLDVDIPEWDQQFTPLAFAIVGGHLPVVEELVAAGADVQTARRAQDYSAQTLHPLTLTFLLEDEELACKMVEKLIQGGAIITAADASGITIFHHAVVAGKLKLAETMLRCDPNGSIAANFLAKPTSNLTLHPLVSAVSQSRVMTAMLVANGASPIITEVDYDRARDGDGSTQRHYYGYQNSFLGDTPMPMDIAIRNFSTSYKMFAALGTDLNLAPKDLPLQSKYVYFLPLWF